MHATPPLIGNMQRLTMEIRPIIATLRRHKLTATLLVLQVAFTCAIVCNVAYLIVQRIDRITVPSGLDESSLSIVWVNDLQVAAGSAALGIPVCDRAHASRFSKSS